MDADPYWVRRREAAYRWFAALCRREDRGRVLDLGCGDGSGTALLAGAGLESVGVDAEVRTAARTYRFGRIAFREGEAGRTGELHHSFDAVVSVGRLERLTDPQSLFLEAKRVLRPGGRLVVVTPNRLTASPRRTRPIDGRHVWEYTPDELHNAGRWRFPDARMYGLWHGTRLRLIERALGDPLALTLSRVAAPDRAVWLRVALRGVKDSDFVVGPGVVREALDLVLVAEA